MKPRTMAELAAYYGLTPEEFERQWNAGARLADAHWADNPSESRVGHTYREVVTGAYRNGAPFIEQEEI